MWTDLILSRALSDQVLTEGLGQVFGVRPSQVRVTGRLAEGTPPADLPAAPLWVERVPLSGAFPLQVSIFLPDRNLQNRVRDTAASEAAIAGLCARWRCRCLFSDDALNPYTWLLMHPTGLLEAVTVDASRLDDQDQFVISHVDRVIRQIPIAV